MPDATSPRRFVTTVPQQALFLMNSPFLHDQARRLSSAIQVDPLARDANAAAESVRRLYRRVLGRSPDADELALATAFIRRQSEKTPGGLAGAWKLSQGKISEPPLSPWEQLSQVLLLTNEFMFVD